MTQAHPTTRTAAGLLQIDLTPGAFTTSDGWPVDATGVIAATVDATDATWQSGFLKSPAGALVVQVDGAGTWQMGFLRAANGALVVSETGPFTDQGGYKRDVAGRVGVLAAV